MTRLRDLEEWIAIRQIVPLVNLYLRYAKSELAAVHGWNISYCGVIEELYQETRMTTCSISQDTDLSRTVEHECVSKLRVLPGLFESLVDEKSIETTLALSSKRLSMPFPQKLCARFPNLSKLVQCSPERSPREHLFHIHPEMTSRAMLKCALEAITGVNEFFASINLTYPRSFAALTITTCPADASDNIQCYMESVLDELQLLFSECTREVAHRMMVQFPSPQDLYEEKLLVTLDLLLSSCIKNRLSGNTVWQRASCSYPPNVSNYGSQDGGIHASKNLCDTIERSLGLNRHLRLNMFNGELTCTENTDISPLALQDDTAPNKSLYDLIHAGYFKRIELNSGPRFTIWEKRKLALDLGVLFMYLYGCKWTTYGWKADKMHFWGSLASHQRENLLQIPPYLACGPHVPENIEQLFKGPLDFLSFGKLLLELEFGEEIKATQCDKLGRPSLYISLSFALDRAQKSTNVYYANAISGCLSLYLGLKEEEPVMEQIYRSIVSNLEKELACHVKIPAPWTLTPQFEPHEIASPSLRAPIHNITSVAGPPTILQAETQGSTIPMTITPKEETGIRRFLRNLGLHQILVLGILLLRILTFGKIPIKKDGREGLGSRPLSSSIANSKLKKTEPLAKEVNLHEVLNTTSFNVSSHGHGHIINLFDDPVDCTDSSQMKSSEDFIAMYENFENSIIKPHVPPMKAKISVCVIDTGIDRNHPAIKGGFRSGSIQDCQCRSWIDDNPDSQKDVHDKCGHGTHVVQLILNASENVTIYVAKVSDTLKIESRNIERIAAAINYAVSEWNVDIITMSFGFAEIDLEVDAAIDNATKCGKLLFASASNHGNNDIRTYPARHGDVICINASDGKGKDGRMSPASIHGSNNFMTLGIAVPLMSEGKKLYRSGTSYATPIAVGFAVNILELVRQDFGETHFRRLKTHKHLMEKIFILMSECDNGYMFIAPWRLWVSKTPTLAKILIALELGCEPTEYL
ncbi:hypothetical protein F4806DRAFT_457861 [Annulohypoxylon nitens]|nr:hypothetical protein F4806DRAFT_457861 [Annulohypoxylon nitens]